MQDSHRIVEGGPYDALSNGEHDTVGTEVAVTSSPRRRRRGERGMTTAEYAVGTIATVSLGGVLIHVLTNPAIMKMLLELFQFLLKLFWPSAA